MQIEQFIETLFPTQKAGVATKQLSPEQAEKQRKERNEEKWDMIFMTIAVLGTLALVTVLMVKETVLRRLGFQEVLTPFQLGIAWIAGARFDIAFDQIRHGWVLPPQSGEEAQKLVKSLGHGEL